MFESPTPETESVIRRRPWIWWCVAGVICLLAIWLYHDRSSLSLDTLIRRETEYRQLYSEHPVLWIGIGFLAYVGMTTFSIPGASIMTLVSGWLFGFWPALVMVSFASSAGATLSCGLNRTLFRQAARKRTGKQLKTIEEIVARDGDFYVLTLRLLPQVPFFLVNLVIGLTSYPLKRFYVFSQIGMIPATCIYTYAGSQAVDLRTLLQQGPSALLSPSLIGALCALALLPWGMKGLVRLIRTTREPRSGEPSSNEHTTA